MKPLFTLFTMLAAGILTLAPGVAGADSGIRCVGGCTPDLVSPGEPPRSSDQVTVWELKLENTNSVCNEDVHISSPTFVNDPLREGSGLAKQGHAEFLGIGLSGGPLQDEVSYEHEDESTRTLRFEVLTGEDANGCDFQGFDLNLKICDTGGGCDIFDGPCESPTAYRPTLEVRSPLIDDTVGTAVIKGKVTRTIGGTTTGVEATLFIVKVTGCVPGAADNSVPYTERSIGSDPVWKPTAGEYSATGLPAGSYKVRARVNGNEQTKDVTVATGATVTVNFAF